MIHGESEEITTAHGTVHLDDIIATRDDKKPLTPSTELTEGFIAFKISFPVVKSLFLAHSLVS